MILGICKIKYLGYQMGVASVPVRRELPIVVVVVALHAARRSHRFNYGCTYCHWCGKGRPSGATAIASASSVEALVKAAVMLSSPPNFETVACH
jgi:hypothetical protein